ncbi:MAG: DUF58 domain-containing protein [Puniceicoccaceae bacterium]
MEKRTQDMLKKVRAVEIQTRRLVNQALSGSYRSAFKGRGIDFEEVREYAYGDDVRTIDWNVTARSRRPYVKQYREERELSMILMLDLSASGSFGSQHQTKRELATELAAVLAFSAMSSNDKVGLILFTDRIECFIVPGKGRKHVLRIIRELLFFEAKGRSTDMVESLSYVLKMMRKRSVIFLLSDFLHFSDKVPETDPRHPLYRTLRLVAQKHDLICGVLTDPREFELPKVGYVEFEDAETGQILEINTHSRRTREQYRQLTLRHARLRDQALKQSGIDTMVLSTDEPYIESLRRLFAQRSRH